MKIHVVHTANTKTHRIAVPHIKNNSNAPQNKKYLK
jgi:hypothetical protein